MQAVNLLPEYARARRGWTTTGTQLSSRRILPLGGSAAAVLAIAVGLLYLHERSVVSSRKSDLATAQARLVAANAQAAPIKAAQAEVRARLTAMQAITGARVHWDVALGDLGRVLPTGVHLNTLQATSPTPAASLAAPPATPAAAPATAGAAPTTPAAPAAPTGITFTIAGTTTSYDHVALVLDRLALLPWLQNVTLQSTSQPPSSPATFTIGATYVGGGDS